MKKYFLVVLDRSGQIVFVSDPVSKTRAISLTIDFVNREDFFECRIFCDLFSEDPADE